MRHFLRLTRVLTPSPLGTRGLNGSDIHSSPDLSHAHSRFRKASLAPFQIPGRGGWAGNRLPHPATMFALLAVSVIIGSAILSGLGYVAAHPATGAEIRAVNLLSGDGLRRIIASLVSNFANFAPLGAVLVALLGVGVAEGPGFLGAAIRGLALSAPRRLITPFIVFAGIMSNAAGKAGYVILIPLAAAIFHALGRHPMAGLAAAFAGVSGGYSANLVLGSIDPLLAGITQEAARIIDPEYRVDPAANYYFMAVSTFLLTAIGTIVTDRIVSPRLGEYDAAGNGGGLQPLTTVERRGLITAGITIAALGGLILAGLLPDGGFLRDPRYNDILHSPFLSGIVAFIFIGFLAPGIAYGIVTRSILNDGDIAGFMSKSMATMSGYIVLVFFAAQFVAYFGWTNIGLITAIQGADFLRSVGFTGIPLLLSFILLLRPPQLAHGQRFGEMGGDGAGVCSDVHAPGLHPRAHPGSLPGGRFHDECCHPNDDVLRADRLVHASLQERCGVGHAHRHDAPLLARVLRRLERLTASGWMLRGAPGRSRGRALAGAVGVRT